MPHPMSSTRSSPRRSSDWVDRVVHRAAEAELHLPRGEVLDDGAGIGKRACQSFELGDEEGVASAAGSQRLTESRTFAVRARQPLVDVGPLGCHAESGQRFSLGGQILFVGGDRA